ncbi:MAG: hypothetical protein ACREFX_10255, partial [Opitutaceae bacterium]
SARCALKPGAGAAVSAPARRAGDPTPDAPWQRIGIRCAPLRRHPKCQAQHPITPFCSNQILRAHWQHIRKPRQEKSVRDRITGLRGSLMDGIHTQMPPHAKGSIAVKIAPGVPDFHYQFVFNAFTIEKLDNGSLVQLAYTDKRGLPIDVAQILVSSEGLLQMKESSADYLKSFGEIEPHSEMVIPDGRRTPLFANYIRLAMAGKSGEIAFYTVLLQDIGTVARSKSGSADPVNLVQVGLFHSDLLLHKQLVVALLGSV